MKSFIRKFNESIEFPYLSEWIGSDSAKNLAKSLIDRNEIEDFLYGLEPEFKYELITKVNYDDRQLRSAQKIIIITIEGNGKKQIFGNIENYIELTKTMTENFEFIKGIMDRMKSMIGIKFQNFSVSSYNPISLTYSFNGTIRDKQIEEEYRSWLKSRINQ